MAGSQTELIEKLQEENRYLRDKLGKDMDCPVETRRPINTYASAGCLKQESPEEIIDYLFTFHDDPDKTPHYVEIRESAKQFAKVVVRHTPFGGADRVTAIQKIREAVMFANACVALSGRGL